MRRFSFNLGGIQRLAPALGISNGAWPAGAVPWVSARVSQQGTVSGTAFFLDNSVIQKAREHLYNLTRTLGGTFSAISSMVVLPSISPSTGRASPVIPALGFSSSALPRLVTI